MKATESLIEIENTNNILLLLLNPKQKSKKKDFPDYTQKYHFPEAAPLQEACYSKHHAVALVVHCTGSCYLCVRVGLGTATLDDTASMKNEALCMVTEAAKKIKNKKKKSLVKTACSAMQTQKKILQSPYVFPSPILVKVSPVSAASTLMGEICF